MAFAEDLKLHIRRKAHFTCPLCKSIGVEIHHIIPQAEGGADTEDNAAPLCPTCHEIYGGNPLKRKFIKEVRDHWFEICATRYSGDPRSFEAILSKLGSMATKEDLEHIVLKNLSHIQNNNSLPWEHLKYSFNREDYIHPLIVRELLGWISDSASVITSVDIGLAIRSNRFHGEYSVKNSDGRVLVRWENPGAESFSYSFVGASPSGIQIVQCWDWGGGSGVFRYITFFCFEQDRCLNCDSDPNLSVRNRVVLKILGNVGLGDRYEGTVQYRNGKLIVGPDVGCFSRGDEACMELSVE